MSDKEHLQVSHSPSEPLLSSSIVYEVNTPQRGATDMVKKDRKAYLNRIAESNTAKIATEIFFGNNVLKSSVINGDRTTVLDLSAGDVDKAFDEFQSGDLSSAHVISLVKPIAPYSPGGLMVAEGKLSSCFEEDMESQLIFDAPKKVQKEYWGQTISLLKNSHEIAVNPPSGLERFKDVIPFLVEHHSAKVTSDEHPGLRTLRLHHGHLIFFNSEHARSEDWDPNMYRIPTQEKLMKRDREPNLEQFVGEVNDQMPDAHFKTRTAKPLGYQARLRYDDPEFFADFMTRHYSAYEKVALGMETDLRTRLGRKSMDFFKGNIIQPSYGMVLFPNNSEYANLVITPAIVPIGPIETMGILLKRGPEYPAHLTEEEVVDFHQHIIS